MPNAGTNAFRLQFGIGVATATGDFDNRAHTAENLPGSLAFFPQARVGSSDRRLLGRDPVAGDRQG